MFEHEEEEFKKLASKLRQVIDRPRNIPLEKWPDEIAEMKKQLQICQDKIGDMRGECEQTKNIKHKEKVNKYNNELKESQKKINKTESQYLIQKSRVDQQQRNLASSNVGGTPAEQMENYNQQSQLMTEKSSGITQNVKYLSKLANQANTITDNTLGNLAAQDKDLNDINEGINNVDDNLSTIDRLRKMVSDKTMMEKLILVFLVLILIAANLIILFYKVTR